MVSFLDLRSINHRRDDAIIMALTEVVRSGWYIRGAACERFEAEFAAFCSTAHCVGVGNGLDALTLVLRAWQQMGVLQPHDEVIVPSNTFIATVLAVVQAGLTPVLAEPDQHTYNLDPAQVEALITPRTRVVIPVHLYGQCADMQAIADFAMRHGLRVLEDAAQSHGARHRGARAGGLGDAAAFSFYPAKSLGALGDGGAVTTNDKELAECVRALGNYGSHRKYENVYQGCNSRLDDIQAAILSVKLKQLDADNERRAAIAARYMREIVNHAVRLPTVSGYGTHVWHLFVVRVGARDHFRAFLAARGIETGVHYPIPPHKQLAFADWSDLKLPITERIHEEVVSLPISPVHTDEEITTVIEAINAYNR